MLRGFILYSRGSEGEVDAAIAAQSPEEAIALLGAELQGRVRENKWEISFPVGCFHPPALGSKEARDTEGMWRYEIPARAGKKIVIFRNLETEVEVLYYLEELPLLMPSSQ